MAIVSSKLEGWQSRLASIQTMTPADIEKEPSIIVEKEELLDKIANEERKRNRWKKENQASECG